MWIGEASQTNEATKQQQIPVAGGKLQLLGDESVSPSSRPQQRNETVSHAAAAAAAAAARAIQCPSDPAIRNDAVKHLTGREMPPSPTQREWNEALQLDYERIRSVGEECISEAELKALLWRKGRGSTVAVQGGGEATTDTSNGGGFHLYDGFEPSGRMHIAQGVYKAVNVNKCTSAGSNATFVFWVADWFALMNDKMGGDLDKIKTVGLYLIEVWKAAGMNLEHVVFKWASEEITENAKTYWPTMLDVARRFNVTRIKKCCQIMGRLEGKLTAAQVLYPLMQCTDVFFLKADICQLGVDQRKVNMLAREYCDAARRKFKPVILSHHMLYGLKAGQEKMSKSDPDSAIFMEDSTEDVERKIRHAYCPTASAETPVLTPPAITTMTTTTVTNEGIEVVQKGDDDDDDNNAGTSSFTTATNDGIEVVNVAEDDDDAGKASMNLTADTLKNPCLDYVQHIILSSPWATFTAADIEYETFDAVQSAFLNGVVNEEQLKTGLITALNQLLEPVRQHFTNNARARDLLQTVQEYKKENATATSEKSVRRLNLVQLGIVPAGSHLVLAPLPVLQPTLQETMDVLAQLRKAMSGQPVILMLQDWGATVCNACQADGKGIAAYHKILTTALAALDPVFVKRVQILRQSDAVLADPSNYWISVINVGRQFLLDRVMGPDMEDSDGVGVIIARLMTVADVAGVEPASVALSTSTGFIEQGLIDEFFSKCLPGVTIPAVTLTSCESIRLQPERETDALKTENDEYFLMDDPKVC